MTTPRPPLRAAGYAATLTGPAPPRAEPVRGYDRLARQAVLTVTGPDRHGTITVGGRCAGQSAVAYALSRR
jgi:hypothetical protein